MAKQQVMYKLQGKSLEAARKLEKIVAAEYAAAKLEVVGKNLAEIQRIGQDFSKNLFEKLQNEDPAILETLGLTAPAIQVERMKDGYPRAYRSFPEVYGTAMQKPNYYMYAPVDYKGNHFVPKGGVALDDKQADIAGNALFAGGWLGNAPILSRTTEGVAMPKDFRVAKSHFNMVAMPDRDKFKQKVFIAAGRSLHVVEDYLRQKKTHDDAISAMFDYIKKNEGTIMQDAVNLEDDVKEEDEYYANMSLGSNRDFKMSIRSRNSGGETVPVRDNKYFKVGVFNNYGEFKVVPNKETPEGQKLDKLLGSINKRPELSAYWQLWNPTSPRLKGQFDDMLGVERKAPRLHSVGGVHYLIYDIARGNDQKDHCLPPDAIPVNPKEFAWIKQDEEDRNRGIKPPPPPAALSYLQPIKPNVPKL